MGPVGMFASGRLDVAAGSGQALLLREALAGVRAEVNGAATADLDEQLRDAAIVVVQALELDLEKRK